MSVKASDKTKVTPPAVMFSHFGINCDNADKLEDFYTRVLGFCVSDHGLFRDDTDRIIFMTRRPREHHQFVLAAGRPAKYDSTVGETGFTANSLNDLRYAEKILRAEDEANDIICVDHGISWTLYFRDPEGNRCSISVETEHYVPQPAIWPLDLKDTDQEIILQNKERCQSTIGYMTKSNWSLEKKKIYSKENRLTNEGPETGNANPDFERPSSNRKLLHSVKNNMKPPLIAQSHCGFKVKDMDMMIEFYDTILGYAVTDRGIMPEMGDEPKCEYAYLSRDPYEHHQLILISGRDMNAPTSVNQLSLRILSLDELRRMENELECHPAVGKLRNTCHGNSFSIYFPDPEGNIVELAVESVWYVPAPHGAPLDLSWSNQKLLDWAEDHCHNTDGFMMRADWKIQARKELIANGHLEAETASNNSS